MERVLFGSDSGISLFGSDFGISRHVINFLLSAIDLHCVEVA